MDAPVSGSSYSVWVPAHILDVAFPIQFHVNGLGKQLKDAQVGGPCPYMGDLNGAPGSWLWISPALAVVLNWGVSP